MLRATDKTTSKVPAKFSVKTAVKTAVSRNLKVSDTRLFSLLAETFQALGDASRVQIVWALTHGELCVSELVEILEMSQPAVSHHLRTLRNLHLVRVRREGRTSHYSLDDEHIGHLLKEGIVHVEDLLK